MNTQQKKKTHRLNRIGCALLLLLLLPVKNERHIVQVSVHMDTQRDDVWRTAGTAPQTSTQIQTITIIDFYGLNGQVLR